MLDVDASADSHSLVDAIDRATEENLARNVARLPEVYATIDYISQRLDRLERFLWWLLGTIVAEALVLGITIYVTNIAK